MVVYESKCKRGASLWTIFFLVNLSTFSAVPSNFLHLGSMFLCQKWISYSLKITLFSVYLSRDFTSPSTSNDIMILKDIIPLQRAQNTWPHCLKHKIGLT
jgi:hypothetical protein